MNRLEVNLKHTVFFIFYCFLALVLSISIFTRTSYAASVTEYSYGDFSYIIDTGVIEITEYKGNSNSVEIPNAITHDGTTYKVRSIGASAFSGNTTLSSVIIPENVATIGNSSFRDCINLTSITINGNIDSVSLGKLRNPFVNTGSNSGSITVIFGDGVKVVPENLFNTNEDYDSGNGKYAYVTKVTIPDSVTEIGEQAFSGCYDLKDVVWGKEITVIGRSAFRNTNITDIVLPASITTLENLAFADCVNLRSITVNGTIDKVESGKLRNPFVNAGSNSGSITVTFGSGVKKIANYMFNSNASYESGNGEYAHITEVVIPDSVTEIGDKAFGGCYDLKDVTWGNGINSIGTRAFSDCSLLKTVLLPHSLQAIESYAFYGAGGISKVYYDGSKNNWNSVSIKEGNENLTNASLYYNIAYVSVKVSDCSYNGKAQKPKTVVKDGSDVLKKGSDYTVSYSNNISVGTANVKITGKGNYYGTKDKSFRILKSNVGKVVTQSSGKYKVTTDKTVALTKAKNKAAVTVPSVIKIDGITYKVTQINAYAFKGSKIRTVTIGKNVKVIKKNAFKGSKANKLILKTKLLKKAKVKGSLKGSEIKTIKVKVGSKSNKKTFVKKYKKIFTKSNAGRKAKVI